MSAEGVLQPEPAILLDIEDVLDAVTSTTAAVGDGLNPFVREPEVGDPSPERCGGWTDLAAKEYLESVVAKRDLMSPTQRLLNGSILTVSAALDDLGGT